MRRIGISTGPGAAMVGSHVSLPTGVTFDDSRTGKASR